MQAIDWEANASLSSTASRSSTVQPARASALRVAGTGPMPMISGATPALAAATSRARGVRPCSLDEPLAGDHDRGGAVVERAGVAGGDEPVGAVERPQRGQPLEAGVGARPLVDGDTRRRCTGTGDDLGLEPPVLDRVEGALVGAQREGVELLAGQLPLLRDPFGGLRHGQGGVGVEARVGEAPPDRGVEGRARAGRTPWSASRSPTARGSSTRPHRRRRRRRRRPRSSAGRWRSRSGPRRTAG